MDNTIFQPVHAGAYGLGASVTGEWTAQQRGTVGFGLAGSATSVRSHVMAIDVAPTTGDVSLRPAAAADAEPARKRGRPPRGRLR